jgi:hypothetical protein
VPQTARTVERRPSPLLFFGNSEELSANEVSSHLPTSTNLTVPGRSAVRSGDLPSSDVPATASPGQVSDMPDVGGEDIYKPLACCWRTHRPGRHSKAAPLLRLYLLGKRPKGMTCCPGGRQTPGSIQRCAVGHASSASGCGQRPLAKHICRAASGNRQCVQGIVVPFSSQCGPPPVKRTSRPHAYAAGYNDSAETSKQQVVAR